VQKYGILGIIVIMYEKFFRVLRALELEEKVLHIGVLLCLFGLLFPWVGILLYGNAQQWNGFGYHTGFIGHSVFLIQLYLLAMTVSPLLTGRVLLRKQRKNVIRLLLSALCTAFILAAFSILLRLTSEVSGAEIRFGIYIALIGSSVTTLYSFLRYQEELQNQAQSIFHHPDEPSKNALKQDVLSSPEEKLPPLPPPPPQQSPPEDHPYKA
jgi:MFS family permease